MGEPEETNKVNNQKLSHVLLNHGYKHQDEMSKSREAHHSAEKGAKAQETLGDQQRSLTAL